jgi:NTE family protein
MSKSVSLVLGSGGARGYAHIGAIQALVERGYKIKAISGSSMGALVGGLYASGKLDEYVKWVSELDVFSLLKLLDFSFANSGMIKGEKIFAHIESIIGDVNIEDLSIPFTAVATDLNNQKSVWFQNGNLLDAIRASIAIPTVFTPKVIGGVSYVDGGILNPIPTVPLLATRSDLTIAVDAQSSTNEKLGVEKKDDDELKDKILNYLNENIFKRGDELNGFKIVSKSIETMQNALIKYELAAHQPDIIVNIPRGIADFYDFHKAKELIAFGKERMNKKLDEFESN